MSPPQSAPNDADATSRPPFELSAEQRMLLDIRDTLYEGSWEDFVHDLRARLTDQPHVFDVVPDSVHFADTIRNHLHLIDDLKAWEHTHGKTLHAHPAD